MKPIRANVANGIVVDIMPPQVSWLGKMLHKKKIEKNHVVVLCAGMPSNPIKASVLQWLSQRGYWVVSLRYRGTWESSGTFLDHDPAEDVRDVIDALFQPIKSVWDEREVQIRDPHITVIGISFGGPAALFASTHPRVQKVISLAGVVDWRRPGEDESLEDVVQIVAEGYPGVYACSSDHLLSLSKGTWYNPITQIDDIDVQKVYCLHDRDDTIVSYESVEEFTKASGVPLETVNGYGHMGSSTLKNTSIWKHIEAFIFS